LKYRRFHGRIDAMDYQASPTTQMPIKSIPELNEKFKRMKNESEEDSNLRVEIAVRENYERIRRDINLILYLELCRFDIQKMDKVADIRLNLIGDAMLKYICKINQYQGENGLTPEGEKFKVKIDSMLTLFANQIRPFIYMEESEVQNKYANNSIVYASKTQLTDFNSPTCKALQVQYNQFELLLYNEVEDPRFTINSPEEEFFA
jgi:hypothetical protein